MENSTTVALPAPANGAGRPGRPYFLMALVASVVLHAVALGLFRLPPPPGPERHAARAWAVYAGLANSPLAVATTAEAALDDPLPLFIPTKYNFASRSAAALPHADGWDGPLAAADAAVNIPQPGEAKAGVEFELKLPSASTPEFVDVLKGGRWELPTTFGQQAPAGPKLPARGAHVRVTRREAGSAATPVAGAAAAVDETWPVGQPDDHGALWGPVHYWMMFDDTGLVAAPFFERTSGVDPVDDTVLNNIGTQLEREFRRRPLPAGVYDVLVEP